MSNYWILCLLIGFACFSIMELIKTRLMIKRLAETVLFLFDNEMNRCLGSKIEKEIGDK